MTTDAGRALLQRVQDLNGRSFPLVTEADIERVEAEAAQRAIDELLTPERVARAIFEAERPDKHWPAWEEYLASFAHPPTQADVWYRKAERLIAELRRPAP